jgi:hypothetical protein
VFWYTDDVEASKGDTPTPGSLAFAPMDANGAAAGELRYYDQVEVHRMGSGRHDGSVKQLNAAMKSREWPKRKFEIEFTGKRAHLWAGAPQPKRISLRSNFKESGPVTYMREALALRLMNDIGVASQRAAHVRLFLNGEFYGLYLLADEIDSTWLERQRWPADTILLKAQHWKVCAWRARSLPQCADAPAVLQPASPGPPPGVSADAAGSAVQSRPRTRQRGGLPAGVSEDSAEGALTGDRVLWHVLTSSTQPVDKWDRSSDGLINSFALSLEQVANRVYYYGANDSFVRAFWSQRVDLPQARALVLYAVRVVPDAERRWSRRWRRRR